MKATRQRTWIFYTSILLCVGSLALTLFLAYHYWQEETEREQEAFEKAKREACRAALIIDGELVDPKALTKRIANDLTDGTLAYGLAADRLRSEVEAHPQLFGLGVAFQPDVYRAGLYAPYYVKQQGEFQRLQVEDLYDYTRPPSDDPSEPNTEWYHQPLAEGAGWVEPLFGTASDALLTLYGAPFYRTDPETQEQVPAGVAFVTLSLDDIDELMASLELETTGYGYVLSREGLFIAHPIHDYVGHVSIFELAESHQDEGLRAEAERAIRGQIFSRDAVDNVTGQSSWIFHEPILSAGWSIGIVLNKDALVPDPGARMERQAWIALALMGFLFFLSVPLFRADRGNLRALWGVAITFSVLCVAMIGWIWHLAAAVTDEQGIKIVDRASLDRFLTVHTQEVSNPADPVFIPTGVFIQTIRLPSPNNVALSGYVWQKYADDVDDDIRPTDARPGFVLPQLAAGVVRPVIEEAFRRHEGDVEVIGWYFTVTLRQPFNPDKYPLEHEDVSLRLWPAHVGQNVILTPDLDAYAMIKPEQKPGLEDELVLRGWHVKRSYFSYKTHSYNTNFGTEHRQARKDAPELGFNISLQRTFIDPFVGYLIPLIVVMCMIFAVLALPREREIKEIFSALSYCAAMFFVVAVAHNGLRGKIAAQGMTYLEYGYILMYIAILTVSVDSALFSARANIPLIQYRNNLIPKLLYWPTLLGALLTITFWIFV